MAGHLGDHNSYRLRLSDKRRINVSQPGRGFARESESLCPRVMMSLSGGTAHETQQLLQFANAQFQRTDNGLCVIVCMTPASLGIFVPHYKTAHGRDELINRKHVQLSSMEFYWKMHLHMLFLMFC